MLELFALTSLALVAGLISFSSPCTLPLLPGYVSYVSGLSSSPAAGSDRDSPARVACGAGVLGGALLFVLGFSAVFTALGATASGLGLLLAQNLRFINIVGGGFVVLMGLAATGLLRLPLLQRELRADLSRFDRGPSAALSLGAAFAFGWTPCVGPVLASILATAAGTATVARGALLLFAYSLGLGAPFVALALGVARGRARYRWLRQHTRLIQVGGGALLVAMGLVMMTGGWTIMMSRVLGVYARLGWPPI